jgi:hypothetical protein
MKVIGCGFDFHFKGEHVAFQVAFDLRRHDVPLSYYFQELEFQIFETLRENLGGSDAFYLTRTGTRFRIHFGAMRIYSEPITIWEE